jgi:hypothetical protein
VTRRVNQRAGIASGWSFAGPTFAAASCGDGIFGGLPFIFFGGDLLAAGVAVTAAEPVSEPEPA